MVTINENESLNYKAELFIENEFVKGYYYSEIKLMHLVWQERAVGDDYRKPFLAAYDFSEQKGGKYFLSDIRKQGIVGPDDRKWFEEDALPKAIERGMIKAGVVFDGNTFKMYYINMLLKRFMNKGIPMKFFKDTYSAINWILEK
ncbi:MAG: hypothetical protein JXA77_05950 [Bacteroidales bacterium]|nr:hypothetical protein [Bacteroidales bacterium]MBN2820581.1 hypothetical protein [Bacteroidales bacterium]